jgi:sulfatase maturation enzyme AslB (radical SAM superfamily)
VGSRADQEQHVASSAEGSTTRYAVQGLHVVAKPVGPACKLDCACCFYLEKQALEAVKGPLVIRQRSTAVTGPKEGFAK